MKNVILGLKQDLINGGLSSQRMGVRIQAGSFYNLISSSSVDEIVQPSLLRNQSPQKPQKSFLSDIIFFPENVIKKIPSSLQAISCCFLVLHHNITHEKTTFWRIQNRFIVVFIFFVSVSFKILVQCMLYAEQPSP